MRNVIGLLIVEPISRVFTGAYDLKNHLTNSDRNFSDLFIHEGRRRDRGIRDSVLSRLTFGAEAIPDPFDFAIELDPAVLVHCDCIPISTLACTYEHSCIRCTPHRRKLIALATISIAQASGLPKFHCQLMHSNLQFVRNRFVRVVYKENIKGTRI